MNRLRPLPSRDRFDDRRRKPPLGFRLWFAFCGFLALTIFAATVIVLALIASDPASLGRFLGTIADGFHEKRVEAPYPILPLSSGKDSTALAVRVAAFPHVSGRAS